MKILETRPERYDAGVSLLSLGFAPKVRRIMIKRFIQPGYRVLDLGTGTGSVALLAAKRGAGVTGIDVSAAMLEVAEEKRRESPFGGNVRFVRTGIAEMDRVFDKERFDVVTASLLFSELSHDERSYALRTAKDLLEPGGRIVIMDEVVPGHFLERMLYRAVRLPMSLATFLLTQTGTRPVTGLERDVRAAGFEPETAERFFMGGLLLLSARKDAPR